MRKVVAAIHRLGDNCQVGGARLHPPNGQSEEAMRGGFKGLAHDLGELPTLVGTNQGGVWRGTDVGPQTKADGGPSMAQGLHWKQIARS
jgi:hypothetical protein